ncbi:MAG: T9SS type A sorting domain-containing protein [Saprospiraceae bacterium]
MKSFVHLFLWIALACVTTTIQGQCSGPLIVKISGVDNIAPVILSPGNQTLNTNAGACTADWQIIDPISDNCAASSWDFALEDPTNSSMVIGIADGTSSETIIFSLGTTYVTLTGVDASILPNFAVPKTFNVVVLDKEAPVLVGVPNNVIVSCDAIPVSASVSALDNCGNALVEITETSTRSNDPLSCNYYSYSITRSWKATDKSGNFAVKNQIINVEDKTAPIIASLSDLTIAEANVPLVVNCSDNCMVNPLITYTDIKINGTPPPCATYFYVINRTWTVSDACGNFSSKTQNFTVFGVSLTCPPDKTIYTNSDGVLNNNCSTLTTASMSLTPKFLDNCDFSTLRYNITGTTVASGNGSVAGLTFQKGVSTVTYSLTNATSDNCSFKIEVKDNEAPRFSTSSTDIIDACSFTGTLQTTPPVVVDNCDNNPVLNLISDVTANVNGCATKIATQKYTKLLTRTWRASDVSGNTATSQQKIYLRDMAPPTPVCRNLTVTIGNTNVTVPAATFNNGSADACSGTITYAACNGATCTNFAYSIVFSRSMILPSTATSIVLPVRLRVSDGCGNISYCISNVTLQKAVTLSNASANNISTINGDQNVTSAKPTIPSTITSGHGNMECFPNPFTEDLNINFNLTSDVESATLKLYDNRGRLLQTLNQGKTKAGYYKVRWNLEELNGGLYHVCLELNENCVKMQRVIMIK